MDYLNLLYSTFDIFLKFIDLFSVFAVIMVFALAYELVKGV